MIDVFDCVFIITRLFLPNCQFSTNIISQNEEIVMAIPYPGLTPTVIAPSSVVRIKATYNWNVIPNVSWIRIVTLLLLKRQTNCFVLWNLDSCIQWYGRCSIYATVQLKKLFLKRTKEFILYIRVIYFIN